MSTKIEYVEETWNPVTGCTPVSPGCARCYAQRFAIRFRGRFGYPKHDPFHVTLRPERLQQPAHWKKPRMVFVCSMGDLFHHLVPTSYIWRVWLWMRTEEHHTYLVLTKRPERMFEFVKNHAPGRWNGPLPNVWLGVTAENQCRAEQRIPILLETPAALRFVSVEPMLGAVDLSKYLLAQRLEGHMACHGVHWVVCGGETGPGARLMNAHWARKLRDDCGRFGIPFFFKKMGSRKPIPEDLLIREYPASPVKEA